MKLRKRITSPIPLPGNDRSERLSTGKSHLGNSSSLITELANQYNKNNDIGVIRSWFRKGRHKANEEHLTALFERVQHIREHAKGLSEFQAELLTQRDRLENEIIRITEASEIAVEQQREEYETFVARHQVERERAQLELARLNLENERIKLEHVKMKAETRIIDLRGNLIDKITAELDLNNISSQQAFVLIKALNQENTEADIFMAEGQLEQMKAEAQLKRAEAKKAEHDAEYAKFKMDENINNS